MPAKKSTLRFVRVRQEDVPRSRQGKHRNLVSSVLEELSQLKAGEALKIELAELSHSKEKIRSALNRAGHKLNRQVGTAADERFLYVWTLES